MLPGRRGSWCRFSDEYFEPENHTRSAKAQAEGPDAPWKSRRLSKRVERLPSRRPITATPELWAAPVTAVNRRLHSLRPARSGSMSVMAMFRHQFCRIELSAPQLPVPRSTTGRAEVGGGTGTPESSQIAAPSRHTICTRGCIDRRSTCI
jgi:hypothetical protein